MSRATYSTHTAIAKHGRQVVENVSPSADQHALAAEIPRLLQAATPPQIHYHNFYVGECKDLTFGVSLSDYATTRGLQDGEVPRVLQLCINEVKTRGLLVEGIYRVRLLPAV